MTAQKEIAQSLDHYAARANNCGARPASSKQCWFLAKLMMDRGDNVEGITGGNTNFVLTSARASVFISDYLAG